MCSYVFVSPDGVSELVLNVQQREEVSYFSCVFKLRVFLCLRSVTVTVETEMKRRLSHRNVFVLIHNQSYKSNGGM